MQSLLLIYFIILASDVIVAYKTRYYFSFALRSTSDRKKEHAEEEELQLNADNKLFKYGVDVAIAEENLVLGNVEEAIELADEAMRMAESFSVGYEEHRSDGRKIKSWKNVYKAYAQGILADAKFKEGQYEAASELYRSALHRYEAAYQAITRTSPEALELIGSTQLIAASLLENKTDYDTAVKTCQLALGLTQKLMPPNSREVAYALTNLAKAYIVSGDVSEGPEASSPKAIGLLRYHDKNDQIISAEDEEITFENEQRGAEYLARACSYLGDLHVTRGNLDAAIDVWSNFVESKTTFWEEEGVTEPEGVDTIEILCKLSVLLFSKDRLQDAETHVRRALWSLEIIVGYSSDKSDSKKQQESKISDLKCLLDKIHELKRYEDEARVGTETNF